MTYYFICECGKKLEVDQKISEYNGTYPCDCGKNMEKDWEAQKAISYTTRADGFYGKPI